MTLSDQIATWLCERLTAAGADGFVCGLSGGVDSATSAALAVHAWTPPLPPVLTAAGIAITAAGAACLDPPALTLATGALGLAAVIGHLRRVRRRGGGDR